MSKHMNFQNYLNLAENDWDFLGKLIHQSILGLEELHIDYQEALETHNIDKLRAAIHKIKPTLIILESNILLEYLEEAKQIIGEKKIDAGKIFINSASVNQAIEEIIETLENYVDTHLTIE